MRLRTSAACAALAAMVWACRPERSDMPGAPPSPATTRADTAMTEAASDSLGLELVLPPSVPQGVPVPIKLRVQNRSRRTLDLYLRGRAVTFDVIVARPDGEVVWRRLEDEIIPAILQIRALAPSERLEADAVWEQRTNEGRPVPPGEYTARGLLLVEGEPLETPGVGFRVAGP